MHQSDSTSLGAKQLTVIEPHKGWDWADWKEIFQHRDLLYFLVWRDIKVRYKQTALGALWAILQPVTQMLVFTIFFGNLAGMPSDGLPYPIFVYAGLLPWMLFASAVTQSSSSVVGSAQLITKVYFPRIIIPLASIGSALVDFLVAGSILVVLIFYYGILPGLNLLMVPLLIMGTIVTALGVGLFVAALNVAYRDFRYVVPFMVQLWLFVTPVIYPMSIIPNRWHWLLYLNPMAGMISGYRAAVLGRPFDWNNLVISYVVAGTVFVSSIVYFRRREQDFTDVI